MTSASPIRSIQSPMLRRFLRVASASTQTRIRAPRYASDAVANDPADSWDQGLAQAEHSRREPAPETGVKLSPVTPTGTRNSYSRPGAQTARTRASGSRLSSETSGCDFGGAIAGSGAVGGGEHHSGCIHDRYLHDGVHSRSAGFQQPAQLGVVIDPRQPELPLGLTGGVWRRRLPAATG